MPSPMRKFGLYLNLVYSFPASVAVGLGGGYYLDQRLGTGHWLAFVGFLLGLGAGFQVLYMTVKLLKRGEGSPPPGDRRR